MVLLALTIAFAQSGSSQEILDREVLWTVSGDGQKCVLLSQDLRAPFQSWRPAPSHTRVEKGIFGLANPSAPDQLVLFFASKALCARARRTFTQPKPPMEPVAAPGPGGNSRDISLERAKSQALAIALEESLFCACRSSEEPCASGALEQALVVPIRAFGPAFAEWRDGDAECRTAGHAIRGRRCAERASTNFRRMRGDLYNIATQGRGAAYLERAFDESRSEECVVDRQRGNVRPAHRMQGRLARVYLYMNDTYGEWFPLSGATLARLRAWDAAHPPNPKECGWAAKVSEVQGNTHALWTVPCARFGALAPSGE